MAKRVKEESKVISPDVKKPIGLIIEPEELIKEVKVQDTGRQFILQLPREFTRVLEIKKGDIFVIKVPLKEISKYSIKLKRKIK
jgi:hypothetical protein